MKNTRKKMLLSSIAMLLVALIALGSATYAWFTINKTVTADSITVKAATAKGLQITGTNGATVANMDDSGWVRDYSFKKTNLVVDPISVGYTTTMQANGYYPADNKANGVATAAGSKDWQTVAVPASPSTNDTTVKDAYTDNGFIAAYRVGVKATSGTITGVSGSIGVVDNSVQHSGDKYVRAVLVDENGSVAASYGDGAATTDAITGLGANNTYDATQTANQATPSASTATFSATGNAKYFTLYVWYEGQDTDCVDNNQEGQITFKLTFSF